MSGNDQTAIDKTLFEAAENGDVAALGALLDRHPDRLYARSEPYEWTLLHTAARHPAAVALLLTRGLDANVREKGDNTYAMHWAAAAGTLESVRLLIDAGGDVVGSGDDHELEVIGWATCWDGCDDDAHRAVVDLLLSRGAKHHIFSAVAMNLGDEVRRLVADGPSALSRRQSRNENHRTPLQFAVIRNRPEMVALLLELGADPLGVDGAGQPAASYVRSPDADRPVMERIHAMTAAEFVSAGRGSRPARVTSMDLAAAVALEDWKMAERLVHADPSVLRSDAGVLHLMAKRNHVKAIAWLLDRGADPNGRWAHWDADVTPLHLAASQGHSDAVRLLLARGANPTIRDSKHDSDPLGWAEFFQQPEAVRILKSDSPNRQA
jgi:ankyrin repeat protein